jgi:tetratricopeptide (TPR) repeat protein
MLFPAHIPTRPQTFLVRSGSKRVPWCAAVLTLAMIATATAAEERETCQKAEGQAAVAACTAVISSGQLQGHDLAAAYFSRAFNLNKLGEPDRAIEDYSEAIRLDPKYVLALNNRCAVYNAKHDYDRAIRDCELFNSIPTTPTPISVAPTRFATKAHTIRRSRITIR